MKTTIAGLLLALLPLAFASPVEPRDTDGDTIWTLNYSGIQPPVYPPDGGCIIVARLYTKDNQLRVFDSAPVCVPNAIYYTPFTGTYKDHPLAPDISESDIKWAAYGWIFPSNKTASVITRPGCVWVDAKLDTDCVAEHELLPNDIAFPNPFVHAWYSVYWTADRQANLKLPCQGNDCQST